MSLDKSYFDYPHRSHGMDHDRYSWSMLQDRKPVNWPGEAKLVIWVNICLQFFPLDQKGVPFKVPGGMTMPYPDLRHFTLRDYGNRVGLFRVLKALDKYGVAPSWAVNSLMAERTPYVVDMLKDRGDEILCHGLHMDALHYGGQDGAEESALVVDALDRLRSQLGDVSGWISPARNESHNTPDLLAENGIRYFCDWVNDDMPYPFKTDHGAMWAMPLSNELEDRFVIGTNLHSEESWAEQVQDAANFLLREASDTGAGRMIGLNIHPWMMGQPHRIKHLEAVLDHLTGIDGAVIMTPTAILDHLDG